MSILDKVFGYSDPLGVTHNQGLRNAAQNAANQAMNQQIGMQQAMAGGAGALVTGVVNTQLASNGAYTAWGQQLSPTQVREKTRRHIADEVTKMAEEIGAPTLLHAVALAIATMEIPE